MQHVVGTPAASSQPSSDSRSAAANSTDLAASGLLTDGAAYLLRLPQAAHGGAHPVAALEHLGFRASAYLMAGGFPEEPTAEDHAFVSALTACGSRVLRTRELPVVTSARRESRAPHGFSRYLAELDAATA